MHGERRSVFITGGSGYLGRPLISMLLERGHDVRALVRQGSERKLPPGCTPVFGDALDASSYAAQIPPSDTFVQLVGVAHPSPSKGAEFRRIDFASASGAIKAASESGVRHFVYLSVAHPAPMMKTYIEVRAECEALLRATGMNATVVRPWYVLGPGHRWPYAIIPMYWLFSLLPPTREGARRLGLVTLKQMTNTLANAVDNPCVGIRVVGVPEIREGGAIAAATA